MAFQGLVVKSKDVDKPSTYAPRELRSVASKHAKGKGKLLGYWLHVDEKLPPSVFLVVMFAPNGGRTVTERIAL